MAFGYIYKVTNLANGKTYIGQTTKSLEERWREHLYTNPTRKYLLHKAIQKYGKENFKIELLAEAHFSEMIDDLERFYITQYNSIQPNGYNLESGGNKYKKLHEDVKKKIKDSNSGFRCKQPNAKPITCMDIKTGIEWSYPNMGAAEHDGFCRQSISGCLRGREWSHAGKRWKWAEQNSYLEFEFKKGSKKLIKILEIATQDRRPPKRRFFEKRVYIATSLITQEVKKFYMEDLKKNGYDRSSVERCLNGKFAAYRNMIWSIETVRTVPLRPVLQCDMDGNIVKKFDDVYDVDMDNFMHGKVMNCCNRKPKYLSHKGFKWRYA